MLQKLSKLQLVATSPLKGKRRIRVLFEPTVTIYNEYMLAYAIYKNIWRGC